MAADDQAYYQLAEAGGHAAAHAAPRRSQSAPGGRLLTSPFLSQEERQGLAAALSPPKKVEARVDLAREGDRTDSLFIITEGWACRYTMTPEGSRQFPALLVPGDVCNLDSLMFERLDYGVRTLASATITTLSRDQAAALVARYPGIGRAFTWLAMVENTTLSKWAQSLGRRSARERLAHLLCELSVRLNAEQDGESSFGFPLTQEHMADALGLTPVHVNRTVRQLRDEGLVDIKDHVMTLSDVALLQNVGGFDQRYLHVEPIAA